MLGCILVHLAILCGDPVPLVLKSGTVLECESIDRVGDWVVVRLAEGFDIKATEGGPRRFKVAAAKVDWIETERRTPKEEPPAKLESSVDSVLPGSPKKAGASPPPSAAADPAATEVDRSDAAPEGEPKEEPASVDVPDRGAASLAATLPQLPEEIEAASPMSRESEPRTQATDGLGSPASISDSHAGKHVKTFRGIGAQATQAFELARGPHVIEMRHDGSENFAVMMVEENGKAVFLLANEIGAFSGSKRETIDIPGSYLFSIEADGEWSIRVAGTANEQ